MSPTRAARRADSRDRLLAILATNVYLAALFFAYDQYLFPVWEYWGFTLRPRGALEVCVAIAMASWGGALAPLRMRTASSLIVHLLFLLVYVPTIVVALSLDADRFEQYGYILLALAFGFAMIARSDAIRTRLDFRVISVSWKSFRYTIGAAWLLCTVILIYFFGSIMNFVGVEDIYVQRFARGDIDYPGLAYVQSLFVNGICAFAMAYGLVCKRRLWFLLGTAGCVLMYAISATKFVIALPFLYLGLDWFLRRAKGAGPKLWKVAAVLAFATFTIALTFESGLFLTLVAAIFLMRTIGVPGLTLPQYNDLFSVEGFTWWSHVKGFSWVIPAPARYASDPLWPSLGNIIGERIYANPDLQANANLWAGDGVAAAGALGVVVISLFLAIWLWLLDQSCRAWSGRFVILAVLPFALSMTNAQFFTSLLSFGGIFWLVLLSSIRREGAWPTEMCAPSIGDGTAVSLRAQPARSA